MINIKLWLSGCIIGDAYINHKTLLSNVAKHGMGEQSATDPVLIIL